MVIEWLAPGNSPELLNEEVHVWAVPTDASHFAWGNFPPELSSDERARATQFALDDPRRRFVIARLALRRLLGNYLNLPPETVSICTDPNGKPRLGDSHSAVDLKFNLTHSGNLALFAFAIGCDVGVDVEQIRSVAHAKRIADRYFHPSESREIESADRAQRDAAFLRCWTGKEAVLKAIGGGLAGSLASFRVPTDFCAGQRVELPLQLSSSEPYCWLQSLAPCAGYIGAFACLGHKLRVRCFALRID